MWRSDSLSATPCQLAKFALGRGQPINSENSLEWLQILLAIREGSLKNQFLHLARPATRIGQMPKPDWLYEEI
jgi:hypothetical protein